jgi:hypothetical protein
LINVEKEQEVLKQDNTSLIFCAKGKQKPPKEEKKKPVNKKKGK